MYIAQYLILYICRLKILYRKQTKAKQCYAGFHFLPKDSTFSVCYWRPEILLEKHWKIIWLEGVSW